MLNGHVSRRVKFAIASEAISLPVNDMYCCHIFMKHVFVWTIYYNVTNVNRGTLSFRSPTGVTGG